MSANPWQAFTLNTNLIYDGDANTPINSGIIASELPLVNDNINRNLSNYTAPMGMWNGYTLGINSGYQSEASRNAGTWWQPHGYEYNWAARARGSFHSRIVSFNDEVSRYGIIGSMVSGYWATSVVFDQVDDNAVSYETPYGHGAPAWPIPSTDQAKTQFRDATSLPSDGASRLLTTGSAWNRSAYLHPTYYVAHIVNGGALSTGAVSFMIEQRPSWRMTQPRAADSTHASNAYYPSAFFPDVPLADTKVPIATGWLMGNTPGSDWVIVYNSSTATFVSLESAWAVSQLPPLRISDPRYRQTANVMINPEYYASIWGSLLMIFSTKMSWRPIYLYDFAITAWAASTYKRIAGIAVDGMNIWALSESGDLALVDFSVSGGQVLPKAAATAVTGEERYGALVKQGTKLYALVGTFSEGNSQANTTTGVVGIKPYTISNNTWGARSDSPLAARHNSRSITELIALADGRLAAAVENTATTLITPLVLEEYGSIPSCSLNATAQETLVTVLDGRDFHNPSCTRFKLKINVSYAQNISATMKRVPKGSPVGTHFTDSVQVTVESATVWTEGMKTTDWINMPFDPDYDYYFFMHVSSGSAGGNNYVGYSHGSVIGTFPRSRWGGFTGDIQATQTTVPNCPNVAHSTIFQVINGVDNFDAGILNAAAGTGAMAYQVLVYNPTGNVWNTSMVTTAGLNSGAFGSGYEALANCGFFGEVSANKLLLQAGWRMTKTFLVDVSGTLDSTAVKDVSFGQPHSIYSAGMNANTPAVTILKNFQDASVACVMQTYVNGSYWGNGSTPIALAHPDFVWDGTEQFILQGFNGYSEGATTNIAKDGVYSTWMTANSNSYGDGYLREYTYPVHYADNQMTFLAGGANYYQPGFPEAHLSPDRYNHGTYYLPRYWKWSGGAWKVAKSFADAAANPYTLSATADTPVPVMHGMVFSFGPSTNTTFQPGEFHTVNVAYGQVKFARRTRWDWTMFAGRTFHNTETKSIAALNTLGHRRVLIGVEAPITVSGPTGIAQNITGAGDNHTISWPVASGGLNNDAPAVVTYDLSKVPTVAPLIVAGSITTPSAEFTGLQWTNAAVSVRIDYGVGNAPIIKAYDFGRLGYSDSRIFTNWVFQGSNDATTNPTNWTTIETVNGFTWPTGMDHRVAHAIRDISSNTTGYRHYRILFGAEGWGFPRYSSFNLWDVPLGVASFADLLLASEDNQNGMAGTHYVQGLKFEVNAVASPDTAGFTEITPKFRAHNGAFYCFDRQQNVQQLRITTKNGAWWDDATRHLPPVQLWDYASQAVMDSLRLGSSAAPNNTRERGAWDPECMGVSTDSTAIWVDETSPVLWSPQYISQYLAYQGWFNFDGKPNAGKFIMHPYYGFVKLPDGTTGTTLHVKYAWGRRA